jgi:hypothetical protein
LRIRNYFATKGGHDLLHQLRAFADRLRQFCANPAGGQLEDQLKRAVADFLEAAGHELALQAEARTEVREIVGRPDVGILIDGLLCGHLETKAPGHTVNPRQFRGHDRTQWQKFQRLPNLLYTNGREWRLYREGDAVGEAVSLSGDPAETGADAVSDQNAQDLAQLLLAFFRWEPIVPNDPPGLAQFLAPLTRLLRDDVHEAVARRSETLTGLRDELRAFLMPELTDDQFADAYAQTLTYAMLLARLDGAEDLSPRAAARTLHARNTLLERLLEILGNEEAYDDVRLGLEVLQRAIRAIDPANLRRPGRDLWLYFYENFLHAYDPDLARDYGVYYTPAQVVRCQVRLVSQLLRDRFQRQFSFADEGVTTLDPGAGTGTYLVAAIQHTLEQVREEEGAGAVAGRATRLAQNLIGFEILIGPYAVAHLRITRELTGEDAGGHLPNEGLRFFLADTLDSPYTLPPGGLEHVLTQRRLVQERERARQVKAQERVLVCLGNPPYDRHAADEDDPKGGWVRHGDEGQERTLFADFTEPARRAGYGIHLKNLYNLYVYFWRWALWKVFETEPGRPTVPGIVSFITASSYLLGPAFVGMREHMRRCFHELWIINLGGDNHGARREPNVFNIQTPVAIAIGLREAAGDEERPARVWYTRVTGTREEKLAFLDNIHRAEQVEWRECPADWQAPFLPLGEEDFFHWPLLTDIFPWQHSGVQFKRTWPIGQTRDQLEERWQEFVRLPQNAKGQAFRETDFRTIDRVYGGPLPGSNEPSLGVLTDDDRTPGISRYAYRSLDRQWAFYDVRFGDRLRPDLWGVFGPTQIFVTGLLTKVVGTGPALTATSYLPDLDHFSGRGAKDVIPLWRDPEGQFPNVTEGLLQKLSREYDADVGPEDLLAYVFGVLGGLSYTRRFWDELELPGPRVPLTRDRELFRRMAVLGRRLIWLQTYGERMAPDDAGAGVPRGQARALRAIPGTEEGYPEDFEYLEGDRQLRVGGGLFGPVAPEVWAYEVSGLQVVKSWLDYRKKAGYGRRSSPLDEIRPRVWTDTLTRELLELLWVIEHILAMEPDLEAALDQVVVGDCFLADELPYPADREREAPQAEERIGEQRVLL